jgi:hypothetical protein
MADFNVTVTGGDTILVSVPDSLATVIQSTGAGSSIISSTVDSTVTLKSLQAGSGISFQDDGETITIIGGGLGSITTDDVTEGTNLYFTEARVSDALDTVSNHIIPTANVTYDLGSPTNMWRDAYIGPGSLYVDGQKVVSSDAGTINITTDIGQNLTIEAGADISIIPTSGTVNVNALDINLGPETGGTLVEVNGNITVDNMFSIADLQVTSNKIEQTGIDQNIEIATNGTGYLHANVSSAYIGSFADYTQITGSAISNLTSLGFQDTTISWNADDGTLEFPLNNEVTLQIGQENVIHVKNESGVALTNGQVVRVTGASGSKLTVDLANNTSDAVSADTIAVMTQNLGNNGVGYATTEGLVRGLDTSTYTEGAVLWLDGAGVFTQTKPLSPLHLVQVGYVVRSHATEGSIFVSIKNGWELDELHDVLITNIQDGQTIVWDAANSYWKNAANTVDLTGYATETYVDDAVSNQLLTEHADFLDIQGGLAEGQVLVYSVAAGNKWVNTTINSDAVPEGTTNLYFTSNRSINELGDVNAANPLPGEIFLVWDFVDNEFTSASIASLGLATTTDVTNAVAGQNIADHADFLDVLGGLSEGQVLVYSNAAGNKWVNTYVNTDIVPEGTTNLYFTDKSIDGLNDVDTTTVAPVLDDVLIFDGTNWVPSGIVGDIDAALTAILGA